MRPSDLDQPDRHLHRLHRLVLLALLTGMLTPDSAMAQLKWRVSVKFILDANGARPATGAITSAAQVTAQIDTANSVLNLSDRGYRFELIENPVNVSNAAEWFNVDSRSTRNKRNLEEAAKQEPVKFAFRENAINIYVNGSPNSGVCSIPGLFGGGDIILVGQGIQPTTFAHEMGHYLKLYHTQGKTCGGCTEFPDPFEFLEDLLPCNFPGSDDISDTLPDVACWTRDQIADHSFNMDFTALSSTQREQVNDVFLNIMSYHDTRSRLTMGQLDVMTDTSNGNRFNVATGKTYFVSRISDGIASTGSSSNPYLKLQNGIDAASPGDIVLLTPGDYDLKNVARKAVTLRAPRGAIIRAQ